ncbi:MAG: hypothetical protein J2P17_00285 [Mycobacterium sp.]|nr:hypothetical protein [Mycobacterium sp.]
MSLNTESLEAPVHPTVLDALRNTSAAPLADQPVGQVLAAMGIPDLPQPVAMPPLPGLPPLPPLDMSTLIKPVTDLFGGFGTGQLGAGGALNPQSLLQGVIQGINSATQLGEAGLPLLESMQGAGTESASASAAIAQDKSAAVADQATQMHTTMGGAAAAVATGSAQLAEIAAKLALTETLLAPLALVPGGQVALITAAIEAAEEATAVTAATKAQLAGYTATMIESGSPIDILDGSTGIGSSSGAEQLISDAERAGQVAQVAQPLLSTVHAAPLSPAANVAQALPTGAPYPAAESAPLTGITGFTSPTLGAGGISAARAPGGESTALGAWQTDEVAQTATTETTAAVGASSAATEEQLLPPIAAGGASAMARANTGARDTPSALVNARHSDELVGDDARQSTPAPVIGAIAIEDPGPDTPFSL